MGVEDRLKDMGLALPQAAKPAANYVPYIVSNNHVFVAGQIPAWEGELKFTGRLGDDVSIEQGQEAARLCALNILSQVKAACDGDLERVARIVKLGVFVACTAEFTDQPKVANGASDLFVELFGEIGRHARFAVGAPSLPLGVSVEIDAVVELMPGYGDPPPTRAYRQG
ncbi:MAG: RidA family protein [Planctomycetota bacterium]